MSVIACAFVGLCLGFLFGLMIGQRVTNLAYEKALAHSVKVVDTVIDNQRKLMKERINE